MWAEEDKRCIDGWKREGEGQLNWSWALRFWLLHIPSLSPFHSHSMWLCVRAAFVLRIGNQWNYTLFVVVVVVGISCFCFLLLAFVFVFYYLSLLLLLSCLLLRLVLLPVGMQTVASARSSTSSLAMVYLLLLELLTVYLLSWAEFAASAVLPLQLALPTLLKFQMHSAGFGFQLRWDTNGVRLFLATASDFLDSFDYCLRAEKYLLDANNITECANLRITLPPSDTHTYIHVHVFIYTVHPMYCPVCLSMR